MGKDSKQPEPPGCVWIMLLLALWSFCYFEFVDRFVRSTIWSLVPTFTHYVGGDYAAALGMMSPLFLMVILWALILKFAMKLFGIKELPWPWR